MEDAEKKYIENGEDGEYVVRTCAWSPPGDHPVGCGLRLTVKDGKLVKVEGDPTHPVSQGRLCPRCLALKEYVYHPDRIIYPMRRAKEDRGKDAWERITWDQALDIIEEKTNYVKEHWGNQSIVVFTGTGREATLYNAPLAFAALQTPHDVFSMSGVSCYGPRCAVANFILGAGYPELDYAAYFPDRYDDPRYEVPKYIVLWGKDPLKSNGDGLFGHAIIDLMKRGSEIITIDPRLTWTAAHSAFHLQLRPATDAAVGLGLINIVIQEDLYDHEFVEKWCYGFDELAERAAEYPPERVEEISWVPADLLREAARAIGTSHPCSFLWGLAGADANSYAVQAGHCMLDLAAITGNLDVPGGVTLSRPTSFMGKWRYECTQYLPEGIGEYRIVDDKYVGFSLGSTVSHPDGLLNHMEASETDPDVYPIMMTWLYGTNMLNCITAQPQRWYKQLMRTEFNVVQDTFMTSTAMAFCDLFLPVSTFAEHDGIVLPHFGRNTHFLGAMNKAIEVGECKSDLEIDFLVGKRLNPEAWPYDDVADFFTKQIQTTYDFSFEDLQNDVVFQQPFEYYKYEKGLLRADGQPGFNTPTTLVELASTMYEDWGDDSLPYYQEPDYSPISQPELAEKYPLILTTGARNLAMFHSEHRQIESLRKLNPWPTVQIHPDTAAQYGIEDGDWVCLENMFGRCIEKADVTPVVDPRVVHASHAWWYPEQDGEAPNLFGMWKSNINTLVAHDHCGAFGYGAPYKSMICSIRKVDSLDACGNEMPPIDLVH